METFDHVIVGGGIVGASVAYHLTRKSAGTVLVLERNDFASAASSRAAGLVLQASTKSSKTPLAKLTRQYLYSKKSWVKAWGSTRLAVYALRLPKRVP